MENSEDQLVCVCPSVRRRRQLLEAAFYAALISGVCFFLYRYREDFLRIKPVEPGMLLPVALLTLVFLFTNGLHNRFFFQLYDLQLRPKEWFGLSVVNTFGNFVLPFRGGTLSIAVYLKQKYQLSYSEFVGALSATYIIVFWVNSFIGLVSLVALYLFYGQFSWLVFAALLVAVCFFSGLIIFAPEIPPTRNPFFEKFAKAINSWRQLRARPKILFITAAIAIVNVLLMTLISYYEFLMFGAEVPPLKLLVVAICGTYSIFLAFTPAGIGVREALAAFSGLLLGLSIPLVILASVVDRLVNFVLSLVLGCYYYVLLLKELKRTRP